ncbi:MAG TPA: hypothetical protein VLT51_14355 [Anaerolineales bacterium]|nr:hypothetical protein [Anaerolineales bacterium]
MYNQQKIDASKKRIVQSGSGYVPAQAALQQNQDHLREQMGRPARKAIMSQFTLEKELQANRGIHGSPGVKS